MTIQEATILRDEYVKVLVSEQYDLRRPDWPIKDVIVSNRENAGNVYNKMHDGNMSNEMALSFFQIKENDYDALIIAEQCPWESSHLLIESARQYLKAGTLPE